MKRNKANKNQKRKVTSRAIRQRDTIPWRYCLLTLVCGSFLVVGFFGAARQHFASIDYGIKNSKLRKEIKDLESEQKRLILSREMAYTPAEIKKAAKKFGFVENSSKNFSDVYTATNISLNHNEMEKRENIVNDKKESDEEKNKKESKSKSDKSIDSKKNQKEEKDKTEKKNKETNSNKVIKEKASEKIKKSEPKREETKIAMRDRKVRTKE